MTLKSTYFSDSKLFHDLKAVDRDNFSYDGAKALQAYLDDLDFEIEYDPIAFCCDFAEYTESEYQSLANEYSQDFGKDDDFDQNAFLEWLGDQTVLIEFNGGVIIQSF